MKTEQQPAGEVLSLEQCLDQWDGLPFGKDDTEWYPRKSVLRAMEEYAQQFKSRSEAAEQANYWYKMALEEIVAKNTDQVDWCAFGKHAFAVAFNTLSITIGNQETMNLLKNEQEERT